MKEDPWEYEARTGIKAPFTREEEALHVEAGIRDATGIQALRSAVIEAMKQKQVIPVKAPVAGAIVQLDYDYVDGYSVVIAEHGTKQEHRCRLHDIKLA